MSHSSAQRDRLVVFGTLWSCALLFHQVAYGRVVASLPDSALVLAAVFLLLSPGSKTALFCVGVALPAAAFNFMPMLFHHWYLACWTGIAASAAIIQARRTGAEDVLFASLRWMALLVYWAAAFHKLNSDYFTASTACGPELTGQILSRLGGQAPAWLYDWPGTLGFAGFAAEVAIPVLLLGRPTRWAGLALAAVVHAGFAVAGYPRFSLLMLALLTLFVLDRRISTAARLILGKPGRVLAALAATLSAGIAVTLLLDLELSRYLVRTLYLSFYVGTLAFAAGLLTLALLDARRPAELLDLRVRGLMLLGPAAIVFSVAAPYLGLGTLHSFSMYSNLRTEGGSTNHYLIPSSIQVFGYQRDLARVVSVEHPWLEEYEGMLIPHLGLRSAVDSVRDLPRPAGVRFEHGDQLQGDADLVRASFFERKLLAFRSVEPEGPRGCTP